jgi:hypothetical protein
MFDAYFLFAAGVFACYFGFGNPPVGSNPADTAKWYRWHQRWNRVLKISGVFLLLSGFAKVLLG